MLDPHTAMLALASTPDAVSTHIDVLAQSRAGGNALSGVNGLAKMFLASLGLLVAAVIGFVLLSDTKKITSGGFKASLPYILGIFGVAVILLLIYGMASGKLPALINGTVGSTTGVSL